MPTVGFDQVVEAYCWALVPVNLISLDDSIPPILVGPPGFHTGPKSKRTRCIISQMHSLVRKWETWLVEKSYSEVYFNRCELYGYGRRRQI